MVLEVTFWDGFKIGYLIENRRLALMEHILDGRMFKVVSLKVQCWVLFFVSLDQWYWSGVVSKIM